MSEMSTHEMVKELVGAGLACRNALALISRDGAYDNDGPTAAAVGSAMGSFDAMLDLWPVINARLLDGAS